MKEAVIILTLWKLPLDLKVERITSKFLIIWTLLFPVMLIRLFPQKRHLSPRQTGLTALGSLAIDYCSEKAPARCITT